MINQKYRYVYFTIGIALFLLMQFQIYLKYREVYGAGDAPFSLWNFIDSVNVLVFILSALSAFFMWLCLKTFPDNSTETWP
ncbi:hypothetical protein [Mucilaginibacter gotjawali]|uniref:Bacteriorhodopsin n=2 Tax=Mucilaginibacter gotjawali TaxID=1550579 RepID=A0A839SK10_9SPHI|nr:hypothetical protein [Mucilaginibacter gotjawali]MBB3058625.1 bacteriorhodopsin [Mucilaginibacter gotjawali]BAU52408.1 hypothetical protein MgSA37_00565 [Mucilaginibacter gotjawali]